MERGFALALLTGDHAQWRVTSRFVSCRPPAAETMYGNEYAAHTASSRARATNAAADVSTLVANENTGGGNVNSASANSYELFKRVMSNTKHKPMMGKLNKQVSDFE